MSSIYAMMGVCPQHDVLWDQLTGREHLELFAHLKGVPAAQVQAEVDARLTDVELQAAANVPAASHFFFSNTTKTCFFVKYEKIPKTYNFGSSFNLKL